MTRPTSGASRPERMGKGKRSAKKKETGETEKAADQEPEIAGGALPIRQGPPFLPSYSLAPSSHERASGTIDAQKVLDAFADPVVVVDADCMILYANLAAETFLNASQSLLSGRRFTEILPEDSPLFSLVSQARHHVGAVTEYDLTVETPRIGQHPVTVRVTPYLEVPGGAVVVFHQQTVTHKIDRQLTHRHAARSVTALAAMLAHEVKNPLSGIRGAAQLLEQGLAIEEDRALTQLIIEETERIVALVDRMDVFSDRRPVRRQAVNIHQVLDHVRQLAVSGFARQIRFIVSYDPSLPMVEGDWDLLVQVFLNLVKNAAEAVPQPGGEIKLSTAYWHGVRMMVPGTSDRVHLPLVISVQDNGDGIPEDVQPHLFEPFVTSKPNGSGLGLALVAKIVNDLGGVIEFETGNRGTVFRALFAQATEETAVSRRQPHRSEAQTRAGDRF